MLIGNHAEACHKNLVHLFFGFLAQVMPGVGALVAILLYKLQIKQGVFVYQICMCKMACSSFLPIKGIFMVT